MGMNLDKEIDFEAQVDEICDLLKQVWKKRNPREHLMNLLWDLEFCGHVCCGNWYKPNASVKKRLKEILDGK